MVRLNPKRLGVMRMTAFEILSIVIMILMLITNIIALLKEDKKSEK